MRAGAIAAAAALAACSAQLPDLTQVKLPSARSFMPSNADTYVPPPSAKGLGPVAPADLVDAQGLCAGMAVASVESAQGSDAGSAAPAVAPPAAPRAVGLEMAECDVVRALGQPQLVNIGVNERGERKVTLTYMSGERAGIYQFVGGRLTSLERGPEPPPPPKPDKPAKKKPAAAKKPSAT
jgi:hypothetical protein